MIITKTPFRISFAGGGTDLKDFYSEEYGAVTSTAIDKYMYITVNKSFDHRIRVSYSRTELVEHIDEIQHPLVREGLKLVGITSGIEITSIADIPARTGLGSSSSFCVGMLNALYAFKGILKSAEALAREAAMIEIDIVGEPIGKQDQYISAYGGLQYIRFNPDESVFVNPVITSRLIIEELESKLLMFYTGITRDANTILTDQKKNTNNKFHILRRMRDLAGEIQETLVSGRKLSEFGELLHQGWVFKQELSPLIANGIINKYYQKGLEMGALGGKLLGAGGGGFILFFCEQQNQNRLRAAMHEMELREIPFAFERQGSQIIYVGGI
ncbi:GHMP kinase [bacterium]|nr:GHMP kinase [FCB group bacterium]MBL7190933.1 GHMP kinase [bacterium]